MAAGENATADDLATARRIFEAAAEVIEVPEDKIDAVTALSGSGPAYFYFLVEHLVRAGIEMGLEPEDATKMAIKTAAGAGVRGARGRPRPGAQVGLRRAERGGRAPPRQGWADQDAERGRLQGC